ncbi:MAG: hypothetical protein ACLPQS_08540 [Acidimicrobiales bacterium]
MSLSKTVSAKSTSAFDVRCASTPSRGVSRSEWLAQSGFVSAAPEAIFRHFGLAAARRPHNRFERANR